MNPALFLDGYFSRLHPQNPSMFPKYLKENQLVETENGEVQVLFDEKHHMGPKQIAKAIGTVKNLNKIAKKSMHLI